MSRFRGESGYTMTELLAAMAILLIVMTGLTTLFVAAIKAETDLDQRFQAQQEARLALSRIRREIHCASFASTTGASVTLTLGPYCTAGTGPVTWCTVPVPVSAERFALHRQAGETCDETGTKIADYLTEENPFSYTPQSTTKLATLNVVFQVDIDPSSSSRDYKLEDSIALRNSTRT